MTFKASLLVAALFFFGNVVLVAPETFAGEKGAAQSAAQSQSGVLINATTRNEVRSKSTFQLAKDGKALAPIVISDQASDATKLVAAELKKYLDQITGADFQIETGDGRSGIVLGNKTEFPFPGSENALKIVHGFDGREAYAIRARGKILLLLGATDLGVSHAAYRLLEELGCRWFFPNATGNWEVVPRIADLKFDKDISDRPAFLSRTIWYAWGVFYDADHPASTAEHPRSAGSDFGDWQRRNHMGESLKVNAGHALFAVIQQNQAEFDKHPEYYALTEGKRQGLQIELGNPKVREMVLNYARDLFRNNPNEQMVSIDPADGAGYSESDETKAWVGDPVMAPFKMANEVAVMLQQEFPGKMVGLYAYNWHSDPPPFELEPNVYVLITMGFNNGKLTLEQLFEEWPKKATNLGFYDYYSTWRWDWDMWPGGRVASKNYLIDMFGRYQKANAQSGAYATTVSAESSNNWGVNGCGYYLASRLMWNPDLDVDAVLQDFYDKAFGPASAAMKEYYSLQDNVPPMSSGVVGELFRRLAKARTAAKNDAAVMKRLDDLANYLRYYDLNYRNNHETEGDKAARTVEIQTLMYRNRYSYMNHWEAFRQDSIRETGAADFPRPWKVDKPIAPEETAAWMQDGLKHYPALEIPAQVTFSKEMVIADLGGEPAEYQSPLFASAGNGVPGLILLYSSGGPLRLHIVAAWGNGRNEPAYVVKDLSGKQIASGAPKLGTEFDLEVPVPRPGFYELHYLDAHNTWSFKSSADQIVAVPLGLSTGLNSFRNATPDLYFYVPQGTKTIHYYFRRTPYGNSGPHLVLDPNGKTQASVLSEDGAYLSVAVPSGLDGKAWRFASPPDSPQGFGLGQFHFFNVPNILSTSPARMVLPKDVAAKDRLELVK